MLVAPCERFFIRELVLPQNVAVSICRRVDDNYHLNRAVRPLTLVQRTQRTKQVGLAEARYEDHNLQIRMRRHGDLLATEPEAFKVICDRMFHSRVDLT